MDVALAPTSNFVPFGLTDPNTWKIPPSRNSATIIVDDILKAELHSDLFAKINLKFEQNEPSLLGLVFGAIRGFYSVGVETSEYALPVDSVITVLGEVTKLDKGHYRISKSPNIPYILTSKTSSGNNPKITRNFIIIWLPPLACIAIFFRTSKISGNASSRFKSIFSFIHRSVNVATGHIIYKMVSENQNVFHEIPSDTRNCTQNEVNWRFTWKSNMCSLYSKSSGGGFSPVWTYLHLSGLLFNDQQ